MENSNSTSGQLNLKNDAACTKEGEVLIKLFPFNALALVCFRNTCPFVLYLHEKARFSVGLVFLSLKDFHGGKNVDCGAFCDTAQIHVFAGAMSNGKQPRPISVTGYSLRCIKSRLQ